jgi:hypothetical protein
MKNRILRKIPPFSWSRGYWKFGMVFTVYSFIMNYLFAMCILFFGLLYQPLLWLIFSFTGWSIKPLAIDRLRPCSDCPLREVKRHAE